MKYLILLFSSTFYGQILHHQMISSQSKSATLSNGMLVKQTVGQQSVIGNLKGDFIIIQGFQQNYWAKLLIDVPIKGNLVVTTYPNPFITSINFEFSKPIKEISITVFDIGGRLLFNQLKEVREGMLTLDLSGLPNSLYLVKITNSEINQYVKIIKKSL
ncbi:T9SS type A sorting domain-containing protein [Flavobacterium weaverense]|uniref:Putative secreted protein (Por secretion system target) n=1 Tax=Flavobacterium weaverense TaxID=271156 RepID=A0A3L9ZKM0_9FLAO|nr:T9SS type A sorting domain-containing protein [Flavobacterium weaverense]RMA72790.1 putative secreted protein (Por secretion system target) [Flavobacterium weaverense]